MLHYFAIFWQNRIRITVTFARAALVPLHSEYMKTLM